MSAMYAFKLQTGRVVSRLISGNWETMPVARVDVSFMVLLRLESSGVGYDHARSGCLAALQRELAVATEDKEEYTMGVLNRLIERLTQMTTPPRLDEGQIVV